MKKILMTIAALSMVGAAFAQYDDYGYEESSEPAVTINGEAGVKARAWLGKTEGEAWNNLYDDFKDVKNTEMNGSAYGKVEFNYNGNSSDVNVKFKVDSASVKDNPEDILEEATARGYFGNWIIAGGKMKTVWGKGDKLHVIDNFNANNYTDFIFPEYVDRRLAEPMLSVTYAVPNASNIRIEGIVTPMMTADRLASSGMLVPAAQRNLTSTVEGIMKHNGALLVNSSITGDATSVDVDGDALIGGIMDLSSFSSDNLFEDNIKTLKYAQAGARMTGTLGSIDWGFSYYYGHYKQPSANLENYVTAVKTAALTWMTANGAALTAAMVKMAADPTTLTDEEKALLATANELQEAPAEWYLKYGTTEAPLPSLAYDRLQTFGFELATVLWKFNTRAEVAYNLTEDIAGDNPWIKNNSIGWVVGFDMDLPIHNFNINVQNQGSYILKSNKIKDGDFAEYDVDYNSDGKYTNNKLVINISDKWLNEKLTTECTTIYTIENKEWCVQPKIEYNPTDGLFLTLSGAYICSKNENGEFYNFTANAENGRKSFAQVAVKYCF